MKHKQYIILRSFLVQWINHSRYGCASQFVGEDHLFEEITTGLRSFGVADELRINESMVHFVSGDMCIITRHSDIRIPTKW